MRDESDFCDSKAAAQNGKRPARPAVHPSGDAAPLKLPDLAGLTIIVVDDNADSVDVLGIFLKACGAKALVARSAMEGLTCIENTPKVDAIITDISMPHMDGVELARKVRAHEARKSIPVVALTGFYEDYPNAEEFDAYLRKPVNLEELGGVIRSVTRG
jgi:CheY-like chemotaxis protein